MLSETFVPPINNLVSHIEFRHPNFEAKAKAFSNYVGGFENSTQQGTERKTPAGVTCCVACFRGGAKMNNQEEMEILVGFGRKFKIFLRSEFDFRVSDKFFYDEGLQAIR